MGCNSIKIRVGVSVFETTEASNIDEIIFGAEFILIHYV